jgi:hypothetical protein
MKEPRARRRPAKRPGCAAAQPYPSQGDFENARTVVQVFGPAEVLEIMEHSPRPDYRVYVPGVGTFASVSEAERFGLQLTLPAAGHPQPGPPGVAAGLSRSERDPLI